MEMRYGSEIAVLSHILLIAITPKMLVYAANQVSSLTGVTLTIGYCTYTLKIP